MASISKHNSRWRAQVFRKGIRKSKVFRTKAEAARWGARQEYLLENENAPSGRVLFSEVLDRYGREVSQKKPGANWEIARIGLLTRDRIAKQKIGDITSTDMADWRDRRLMQVSPGSVQREINLLSHVFQIARKEWRMISKSPLTDVARPKSPPPRTRIPQRHEIEAMAFVAGRDLAQITARVYWAFLFACETAMRAGEIAGLSSDTVDYASRVAHLPKTKNGEARDVPLSSEAVRILQSMPDQDLLFNVTPEQISALFARLRKRANVHGLTFHDSRREGTTRLSKKLEVLDLARVTGHKDIRELMTYYKSSAADMARQLD